MIDRRNVANLYPLSPLQEGMLFHALREPDSRAYFEQLDFELPAAVDASAYLQAWAALLRRHDALRTTFAVRGLPQPLQVVLRDAGVAPVHEDLQGQGRDAAEARVAAWRQHDLAQGLDPTAGVPMRLALFTLPGGSHRVVWSFHHILLDGWSLAILQAEIESLYRAQQLGQTVALQPPAPYSAYIRWLGQQDAEAGRRYWGERLARLERPTPLPRRWAAQFGPQRGSDVRDECVHALSAPAGQALARLAVRHGVTPSLVVQSLWGLLLGRLSGSRDAAFVATVSGRPPQLAQSERTVGLFINAIPVRVRCEPDASYADLLARLRDDWLSAQAWQHVPLADVQAAHPLGQRLFDHILVFENYPQAAAGDAHQQARTVHLHEHTHYSFEFQFLPAAMPSSGLPGTEVPGRLRLRFDPALYDAQAVAGWARDFERLLCVADAEPQIRAEALLGLRAQPGPEQVALAASFTAEPLLESASAWLSRMQGEVRWQLAPYNQCLQQLSDPQSVVRQAGLGLLLLRWSDAVRDLRGVSESGARLRLDAQFDTLLQLLAQPGLPPLLMALLPEPEPRDALEDHVAQWQPRWIERLAAVPGLTLLDLRELPAAGTGWQVFDPVADALAHLPYTEAACEAIGEALARAVHARKRPPFKVVAIDCDNTLWDGVVGEAGPLGVRVTPGHQAVQEWLIRLQARGFLLVLASKNVAQDVWAVFDQHPDMRLQREHLADAAIDWQPKSNNLRRLAQRLNLGLDSFIFLDDSPVECAEVMRNAPQVLALPLPAQVDARAAWLQAVWAFDQVHVSAEDRERTRRMQEESRRQAAVADQPMDALVALLALRVDVGLVQPHQQARVAQLTQRTNQFNLSGLRRGEDAIRDLCAQPGVQVLAVEVADCFGDYGLTGVAILRIDVGGDDEAELDTLLLSCRVLGRRVEQAVLSALAKRARLLGRLRLVARCVPTERNEPARQFLAEAPWRPIDAQRFVCEIDAAINAPEAMSVTHDFAFVPAPPPLPVADAALQPASAQTGPASAAASAPVLRWPDSFPMALVNEAELRHGLHYLPLLARCAGWPGRVRLVQGPGRRLAGRRRGRVPTGEREQQIAQSWSEVLGVPVQDAEAHFADLGGHSLHAVRLVARMQHAHGVALSLQTFLSHDSVEALAQWWAAQAPAPAAATGAAASPGLPAPHEPDDAADYPLSFNQQRLWLLREVGADEAVHTLCAAFRLEGALDRLALGQAIDALVRRHDALRTAITLVGDQPRQRLLPAASASLSVHEAALDAAALHAHIAQRARRPFDLARGPLFEATLYPSPDGSTVLALFLHHIISDGWSFGLLLRDLAALYRQAIGHGLAAAAPPAWRHVDYAAWSRSERGQAEREAAQHYWRGRLQSLPGISRLAPDHPAGPGSLSGGGRRTHVLPVSMDALQAWCGRHRVHLLTLLASVAAVLLYRCGGGLPVRLGTPMAGRTRPEFESVVGFFANTVPLCIEPAATESFSDLLHRMQQRVDEAVQHQAYPFDRMVADVQPVRDPVRHPLFDVMVVLQNAREVQAGLPGLHVTDVEIDPGLSEFDLAFEFGPAADGCLACRLVWRAALYLPQTAEALLGRVEALLMAVLRDPACRLAQLPLMPAAEQALLRALTHGPQHPIPDLDLGGLLAQQAALHGERIAVRDLQIQLDYRSLDAAANAFAHQIHAAVQGRCGAVVAVMLERSVEWAVTLLGVLKAGGVYLPLERRHPRARLQSLVQRSGAALLISDPADAALDPGRPWLAPPRPAARAGVPPPVRPAHQDPAYLIFTSGSSGEPKGVRVPHRAFINMALAQVRGFRIRPDDIVLQLASCAFDASLSELFMAWLAGASVAIASDEQVRDGDALAQAIVRHGATVATFTPSHLRQLEDAQLQGLRTVVLAAEPVRGADVQRLLARGLVVFNAYGPTETAVCATLGCVTEAPAAGAGVPIGQPLDHLRVRVVDAQCRDQPLGVAGEIVVEGEGVALGYLAADDDPVQAGFQSTDDGQRRYCTGDIGRWRADGALEILGRADAQVKIRGHRVDAAEVVAALCATPGVRQAEVLAVEGPAGTMLCAFLCGEPQADAPLRARLAERLAPYMLPARLVWLDRMPLTSSGKVDAAALRRRPDLLGPARADPGATEALQPLAAALLPLWRDCLPGTVEADTDFFAAGGDSVTAMLLARRITRELGRRCGAAQCFRTPTVRGMAAALAHSVPGAAAAPWVETWGEGALPVVALPPYPGMELGWAALARHWPEVRLHALAFADDSPGRLQQRYADEVMRLGLQPPWVLLGHSGGGQLALALARRLQATPGAPAAVLLLDTWNLQHVSAADRARLALELELVTDVTTGGPAPPDALGMAYLRCLAALEPELSPADTPLAIPVCHVLAGDLTAAPPDGAHRDWGAVCQRVCERSVAGTHAQLLDAAHVADTVAAMRALLGAAGLAASA